jgi:predicted DNA-binding helix-hairpin-helix protein
MFIMDQQISTEMKAEIYKLMRTPGIEVNDVPDIINHKFESNLNYDRLMEFLSEEYYRCNLDHGRKLCCR